MPKPDLAARLIVAALFRPPRAASLRRWVGAALAGLAPDAPTEALVARRDAWLAGSRRGGAPGALERLVAEDLAGVLAALPEAERHLAAWERPDEALAAAAARMTVALASLGLELDPPAIRLVEALPAAYDHPSLWAVSLDSSDAVAFGVAPGIAVVRARTLPVLGEIALGHVLVHAALGRRSPALLGRGFEEGLAEVLGGLWAAGGALGPGLVDAAWRALRLTPARNPQREALLDAARGVALLHRRHGLSGLAALVRGGREAVKAAEAALARGEPEAVDLAPGAPDAALAARLERLLEAGQRPLAVSAPAYLLAGSIRVGESAEEAGSRVGLDAVLARQAARELHHGVFLAVFDPAGRLLASDLERALGSSALRYLT